MNEIIHICLLLILILLFILWVIQSVNLCKRQNSIPNITDEQEKKNKNNRNIKIIVGVFILLFLNYQIENQLASADILEMVSIIVVIFFILIVAVLVIIFNKKKGQASDEKEVKKLKNILIITSIAIFLLLVGIFQLIKPQLEKKQQLDEEQALELETNKKQNEIERQKQYLADTLMVSREFLDNIQSVFVDCGLGKIFGVSYVNDYTLDDNTRESIFKIFIEDKDTNGDEVFLILHNSKSIYQIILNGKVLYEDGKVLDNANYYYRLTFNQKSEYKYNFEEYIKTQVGQIGDYPKFPKYLDNPSAGDNTYKWGCDSNGTEIAVGWVEHPNYFGVIYKTPFKVHINKKTNRYSVEFLD